MNRFAAYQLSICIYRPMMYMERYWSLKEVQKVQGSVPAVQDKLSYRVVGQMIDRTNDGRTNDSVEKLLPF